MTDPLDPHLATLYPAKMPAKTILNEIEGIVYRSTEQLMGFGSGIGRAGSQLRLAIGDLRFHINRYVADGTFGARLVLCYRLATEAGITVMWMENVLKQLISEKPKTLVAVLVVQASILFALAQDGRIIRRTEFISRDDVEVMLQKMKEWFDTAKELASEQRDNPVYNQIVALGGAITRYLADTARPLPRMLSYTFDPAPALKLSMSIYAEGSHSEEIIAENKIVHPAFCPIHIRAISPPIS
jgi:hypothetical protein